MNSRKTLKRASKALALAFLLVAILAGCGKDEPKAIEKSAAGDYMNDPVFKEKLVKQDETRRGLMKKFSDLRKEYEVERAKDPNSPEAKALKAKMDAVEDEFQANRKRTLAIVRERMRQDLPTAKSPQSVK